jgi:hypothetical protein
MQCAVPEFPRALLKLTHVSVCEVFGYQLARLMDVAVSRMVPIWTDEPTLPKEVPSSTARDYRPGTIGALIEHHEGWRGTLRPWGCSDVDWEELRHKLSSRGTHFDGVTPLRQTVARALALCTFDRHEWGEFGVAGGRLYFFDLERLLPGTLTDYGRTTSTKSYRYESHGAVTEVLGQAHALGLEPDVDVALRDLCAVPPDAYRDALTITGHPKARPLSTIALRGFVQRRNVIARVLGEPVHPVPPSR